MGQSLGVVVGYEGINKGGNMHSRLPLSRVMETYTGSALDLPLAEVPLACAVTSSGTGVPVKEEGKINAHLKGTESTWILFQMKFLPKKVLELINEFSKVVE